MNSSVISVSEILNNAKTLISAGFSAGYNFDEEKAAAYFDELVANSASSPIFSGILIIEKSNDIYTIVDGLQRLTTVSLLLCALCSYYKGTSQNNEAAREKILDRFLLNPERKNEPKLKPAKKEKEIYKKIVFAEDISDEDKNSNLFQTYQTFINKIRAHKISGTALFGIISKMQFMTIFTDKTKISVRELYQSINENKGISQINLISDFIIQQDEKAEKLWQKVIDSFNDSEYLLESFIIDFLTARVDEKVYNNNALYNCFKNYFYKISNYQTALQIIENIHKYSQYYLKIIHADFKDAQVREQVNILNDNNGKDTYPYLMQVLDDLENSHISYDAFLNILMMINLFIKSRNEISISNMSIDFSNLSKELNKMLILKDYVPEILSENKLTINEINHLSNFEV